MLSSDLLERKNMPNVMMIHVVLGYTFGCKATLTSNFETHYDHVCTWFENFAIRYFATALENPR